MADTIRSRPVALYRAILLAITASSLMALRCSTSPAEGRVTHDVASGPTVTRRVGGDGGTLSRLQFAVVGDTRPPSVDDTAAYPTDVIDRIYAGIEALVPRPAFAVSTGDYLFASDRSGQARPQLDLYLRARSRYSGALYPALGNHECTGATASNCGPGARDGVTEPYAAFLEKLLSPIGKSDPYYSIRVDADDGSWTAKLVFVAANAWSPAQAGWLDSALTVPTTYTFVVRHEPASAATAPGVAPSEEIMLRHPYTLAIVGHSHTYEHSSSAPREVVIGNGGAPLTGKKPYGFGVFARQGDGTIAVDMVHWQTGLLDPAFHFVVTPGGKPAP